MKEINLSSEGIKSAIRSMMEESDYSQFQEIAESLDIKKSTFQAALDNNALRVRDLNSVADLLGYEITLKKK